MPLIACIGWGSLIYDPGELPARIWCTDGPELPIEFCRESRDGRITLVITPEAQPVATLWAPLTVATVVQARQLLANREGQKLRASLHITAFWSPDNSSGPCAGTIGEWARARDLAAVVWTALGPRFLNQDGRVPTANEVITHLRQLPGKAQEVAQNYVRRAPPQIRTAYREAIEAALGWFPLP